MKRYVLPALVFMLVFGAGFASAAPGDPIITGTYVDLGANTLLIEGMNLPPSLVYMGKAGGGVERLTVLNASGSTVEAKLKTTDPGTYIVALVKSATVYWTSTVTIGGVGQSGGEFAGGQQVLSLTTADTVVRSITISAPTAGVVIANASVQVSFTPASGNARCSITTGTVIDHDANTVASLPGLSGYSTLSSARGYSVSAGDTTINYVCDMVSGTATLHDSHLTGIFVRDRL